MHAPRIRDPDFAVWPALVVAPVLALTHLTVSFALVTPLCGVQKGGALHAVSAVSLVIALVFTLMAWGAWRRAVSAVPDATGLRVTTTEGIQANRRPSFLALVGTLVGAFSTLVLAAMWVPVAVLPACN